VTATLLGILSGTLSGEEVVKVAPFLPVASANKSASAS